MPDCSEFVNAYIILHTKVFIDERFALDSTWRGLLGPFQGRIAVIRTVLAAGALVLGLAASPSAIRVADDLVVTGFSFTTEAQAQPRTASDPRYQPGSGSCRDGAGRRC
jgi:hypothetical protein